MTEEQPTALGYGRVSTQSQDPGYQREQIADFAVEKKILVLAHYEEKFTGTTFDRPVYLEMVQDIKDGKYPGLDFVIVTHFDRFSRAKKSEADARLEELNDLGVSVWGIDNCQVARPTDSLDERFGIGITLYVAHHVARLTRRRAYKEFKKKLDRQRRGELEPGERPIGRQAYVLPPEVVLKVKRMRARAFRDKKYIWEHYIRKRDEYAKMTYNTFLKVCERQGIE